jgi:hypothetical protein
MAATPHEELEAFLGDQQMDDARRVEVAIQFAKAMVEELTACAANWRAAERALTDRRRQHDLSCN